MTDNRHNNFIAITIGPIYDTIRLTSKPAGLWAASFMFSHIAKLLCEGLIKNGVVRGEEEIISPCFDRSYDLKNGVGLYHDRIIFKYDGDQQAAMEKLNLLFDSVSDTVAAKFIEAGEKADQPPVISGTREEVQLWFRQYLQFHAVAFKSKENEALQEAGWPLSAIELEKTFPTTDAVNLGDLLENNTWIKAFAQVLEVDTEKWPLAKEDDPNAIKNIKDIIRFNSETKTNTCYAIVQSDGDRMGNFIQKQESPRVFSQKCLAFCAEAAGMINAYGGVTVYAGGDDLLFIAPLNGTKREGKAEKEICLLELLRDLQKLFGRDEFFGGSEDSPTISFGVAIRYYKYPMCESFDEAYNMLSRHAKEHRDAAAISLQKHSGQSAKIVIEQFDKNEVTGHLIDLIGRHAEHQEQWLKSVSSKIWSFSPLFDIAIKQYKQPDKAISNPRIIDDIFDNTFDNPSHEGNAQQIEIREAKKLLFDVLNSFKVIEKQENGEKKIPAIREIGTGDKNLPELQTLDALLRFVKLYSEKGKEE